MGWTKRDSDVEDVRKRHECSVTFMRNTSSIHRVMSRHRKPAKRGMVQRAARVPEEVDTYITLSHMIGHRPDPVLLWDALRFYALVFDKITLRRRAS